jgi:hypothetical protein
MRIARPKRLSLTPPAQLVCVCECVSVCVCGGGGGERGCVEVGGEVSITLQSCERMLYWSSLLY